MRKNTCGRLAIVVCCAVQATLAFAGDPGLTCESTKLGVTAKYAQCRLKADAKAARAGATADYSKCTLAKFADAEEKAGAGVCPTQDDQSSVGDFLDACTASLAVALQGDGPLPLDVLTCNEDLVTCQGSLATANSGLATCSSNLGTCTGDLSSCSNGLASCQVDLSSTNADLGTCTINLTSTNADLATCSTNLSTTNSDLGTCQSSLATCVAARCGDGILQNGPSRTEDCDDGNATSGDGCSADCRVEHAFLCTGEPSTCATTCGDGLVGGSEQCDVAGAAQTIAACSAGCLVTSPDSFACAGEPSVCGYKGSFLSAPGNLRIGYNPATAGVGYTPPPAPPASGSLPLARTGTSASTDDACTTIAADLTGKAVLIRRGTCSFAIKAQNAVAAGASAVLIYNNAAGVLSATMSTTLIPVPVLGLDRDSGNALDAMIAAGVATSINWSTDPKIPF